jgi:hypothetical protein
MTMCAGTRRDDLPHHDPSVRPAAVHCTSVSRGLSLVGAIVLVVSIGWPDLLPRGLLIGSAVVVVASLAWGTWLVSRLAALERHES